MKASSSNKCHTKYITFWSSNKHQLNPELPVKQFPLSWMLEPCTGYILNINMQYLRKRDNPNSLFWCVYLLSPKIVSIFQGHEIWALNQAQRATSDGKKTLSSGIWAIFPTNWGYIWSLNVVSHVCFLNWKFSFWGWEKGHFHFFFSIGCPQDPSVLLPTQESRTKFEMWAIPKFCCISLKKSLRLLHF